MFIKVLSFVKQKRQITDVSRANKAKLKKRFGNIASNLRCDSNYISPQIEIAKRLAIKIT